MTYICNKVIFLEAEKMFKLTQSINILILTGLMISNALLAEVWVYPGLTDAHKSKKYYVRIIQGENVYESFVYLSQNTNPDNHGHLTDINHWTTFSFNGKITIEVTKLFGDPVRYCIIRPKESRLKPEVDGHVIKIEIEKPQMLFLEINQAEEDPLFLFADPEETIVPDDFDESVLYYEPGIHDIGLMAVHNRDVYIAGGAYVIGSFALTGNRPIKITGRGIVSGVNQLEGRSVNTFVQVGSNVPGVYIDGITFTDGTGFSIFSGQKVDVANSKFFGWSSSSKGISLGDSSTVNRCFFKIGNDNITFNHRGIDVSNCVIWQQSGGAPFQFSLKEKKLVKNINIRNIDIIMMDIYQDSIWTSDKTIFNCIELNHGILQDILLEDVRIEGNVHRLLGINTGLGGEINGLTFKDIEIEGVLANENFISAEDGSVSNILFDNVEANYLKITNEYEAYIEKRGNVEAIYFKSRSY